MLQLHLRIFREALAPPIKVTTKSAGQTLFYVYIYSSEKKQTWSSFSPIKRWTNSSIRPIAWLLQENTIFQNKQTRNKGDKKIHSNTITSKCIPVSEDWHQFEDASQWSSQKNNQIDTLWQHNIKRRFSAQNLKWLKALVKINCKHTSKKGSENIILGIYLLE